LQRRYALQTQNGPLVVELPEQLNKGDCDNVRSFLNWVYRQKAGGVGYVDGAHYKA
jgi:hypothetical protein